jgi:hypothetical protein
MIPHERRIFLIRRIHSEEEETLTKLGDEKWYPENINEIYPILIQTIKRMN